MVLDSIFRIVMSMLTVAAALSLIAVAVSWITRKRRPALEHACWVIVLLRLVTPPVLPLTIPGYPQWSLATSVENLEATPSSSQEIIPGDADIAVSNADDLEMAHRFPQHATADGSLGADNDTPDNRGENH